MTPEQINTYLEQEIEPKVSEMATSYAILIDNKQFYLVYNGYVEKIAYMLGQLLQDMIDRAENDNHKELIAAAFERGCSEFYGPDNKEEF